MTCPASGDEPEDEATRTIGAAFLYVRVGELIPHLADVVSNSSVERTRYRARCPVCQEQTFHFWQGRFGIVAACRAGCPQARIAAALIERRLAAGEDPEDVWGRADRGFREETWDP